VAVFDNRIARGLFSSIVGWVTARWYITVSLPRLPWKGERTLREVREECRVNPKIAAKIRKKTRIPVIAP